VCNCLEKSANNLSSREVGLLASHASEVAPLLKPSFKGFNRAFKLQFVVKRRVVKDSVLPRFRAIFDNLVDLFIAEKGGSSGTSDSCTF
jgi:hypothetical protein